ncbi:MAG: helix-turn-helix transcriptional regulator [Synergistaceae bacterium]|nr:helix-turn-helix transcriptional regulator [Synergistaceae bacterium]
MKTETGQKEIFEWKNSCKVMMFYRRSLNLSKNKLALSLGVGPSIVGYWEKGIKEPKISNFVKLTQVLGVSESEFLHPSEEVKEKMKEMKLA